MLKPPDGYEYLNVGDIVSKDDLFNSMGAGIWVPTVFRANYYLNKPLPEGRVAFCTPKKLTPAGNIRLIESI